MLRRQLCSRRPLGWDPGDRKPLRDPPSLMAPASCIDPRASPSRQRLTSECGTRDWRRNRYKWHLCGRMPPRTPQGASGVPIAPAPAGRAPGPRPGGPGGSGAAVRHGPLPSRAPRRPLHAPLPPHGLALWPLAGGGTANLNVCSYSRSHRGRTCARRRYLECPEWLTAPIAPVPSAWRTDAIRAHPPPWAAMGRPWHRRAGPMTGTAWAKSLI